MGGAEKGTGRGVNRMDNDALKANLKSFAELMGDRFSKGAYTTENSVR